MVLTTYNIIDLSNTDGFIYNPDINTLSLNRDITWDGSNNIINLVGGETFDGKGYTIDLGNSSTTGIFVSEDTNFCIIKNLTLIGGSLKKYIDNFNLEYGSSFLLRYNSKYVNIDNIICKSNTININHSGSFLGQNNEYININNCVSHSLIEKDNCGGICGSNNKYISINNCYTTGNIQGTNSGGICGSLYGIYSISIVKNSYATGNINGNFSGGIVGSDPGEGQVDGANIRYGLCIIQNCYTTGTINTNCGGITGTINISQVGKCVVQNSYSRGDVNNEETQDTASDETKLDGNYDINNLINIDIHSLLDSSLNKISNFEYNVNDITLTYTNYGNSFTTNDDNYPLLKSLLNTPFNDISYNLYNSTTNDFIRSDTELSISSYDDTLKPYGIILNNTDVSNNINNLPSNNDNMIIELIFRPLTSDQNTIIFSNSGGLVIELSNNELLLKNNTDIIDTKNVTLDNKFYYYRFDISGNSINNISGDTYIGSDGNSNYSILEIHTIRIWNKYIDDITLDGYKYKELPLNLIDNDLLLNIVFTNRNRIYKTYFDNSIYNNNFEYNGNISLRIPSANEINHYITNKKQDGNFVIDLSYNIEDTKHITFNYINLTGNGRADLSYNNEPIDINFLFSQEIDNLDNLVDVFNKQLSYDVNESYNNISFDYYISNGFYISDISHVDLSFEYQPVWGSITDVCYNNVFTEDQYFNTDFTFNLSQLYINIDTNNQFDISLEVIDKSIDVSNNTDQLDKFDNPDDLFDVIVEEYNDLTTSVYSDKNNITKHKRLLIRTKEEHFYGKISFKIKALNINDTNIESISPTFNIEFTSVNDPIIWISKDTKYGTSTNPIRFAEFTTLNINISKNDFIDADLSFNPERFIDLSLVLYNPDSTTNFTSDIVSYTISENIDNSYNISFTGLKDKTGFVNGIIHVFDITNIDLSSNINFYLDISDANVEFTYENTNLQSILNIESDKFFYDSKITIDISGFLFDEEIDIKNLSKELLIVEISNNNPELVDISYNFPYLDISAVINDASFNKLLDIEINEFFNPLYNPVFNFYRLSYNNLNDTYDLSFNTNDIEGLKNSINDISFADIYRSLNINKLNITQPIDVSNVVGIISNLTKKYLYQTYVNKNIKFTLTISDRYNGDGEPANTVVFDHSLNITKYVLQNVIKVRPLRMYLNDFFNGYIDYDYSTKMYNIKRNFNIRDILHKNDCIDISNNTSYRFIIERGSSINGNLNSIDLRKYGTNNSLVNIYEKNVINPLLNKHIHNYIIDTNDVNSICYIKNLGIISDISINGALIDSTSSNVHFNMCYGRNCGSFVNSNNLNTFTFTRCNLINNDSSEFINNSDNHIYILSKVTKYNNNNKTLIMYDENSNKYSVNITQ
jgi:hypothetical protein